MNKLERWFCSQLTGEIVRTPYEVLRRIADSIRGNYGLDYRWKVVWL